MAKFIRLVLISSCLLISSSLLNAADKYRLAWQSRLTGAVGHGQWLDQATAFDFLTESKVPGSPLRYWIEKRTTFFFISRQPQVISVIGNRYSSRGMKVGDMVTYHHREDPARQYHARIQGFEGRVVIYTEDGIVFFDEIINPKPK